MSRKQKTFITLASLAATSLLSYGVSAFRRRRASRKY